ESPEEVVLLAVFVNTVDAIDNFATHRDPTRSCRSPNCSFNDRLAGSREVNQNNHLNRVLEKKWPKVRARHRHAPSVSAAFATHSLTAIFTLSGSTQCLASAL